MREPGAPRNFVPELSSTYAGPVLVNLVSDIINLLYVIFSQISCPFYRVHRGHQIPFRQRGRKEAQALSYICVALELCCDEQSVCNSYFLNIVVYDTTALLFLHSVFFECCIYIFICNYYSICNFIGNWIMQQIIRHCCTSQHMQRTFCNTAADMQKKAAIDMYVELYSVKYIA